MIEVNHATFSLSLDGVLFALGSPSLIGINVMSWTTGLSIFGAITGALGAASGYYAFVLSGYRVKVHIGLAVRRIDGGYVQLDPDWSGGFDLGMDYVPGSESLLIQATNSGRSKIDIGQLVIKNKRNKARDVDYLYYLYFGPPEQASRMPHLLDYGSSCTWLVPLAEISSLSRDARVEPNVRRSIFAELRLGDGKHVQTKNGLTPSQLDNFVATWTAYQRGQRPGGLA